MSTSTKKPVEIIRTAIDLGTGVAATALAPNPVAQGLVAVRMGGTILKLLVERVADARRERMERLIDEAMTANVGSESFAAEFQALLDNPEAGRVVVELAGAAASAIADEVLPCLGLLLREYTRTGKPADGRFRGLYRLLQELSPEEYTSFRAVFLAAQNDPKVLTAAEGIAFFRAKDYATSRDSVGIAGIQQDGSLHQADVPGCLPAIFPRLSHLLYLHGMGEKWQSTHILLDGADVLDQVRLSASTVTWVSQFLLR